MKIPPLRLYSTSFCHLCDQAVAIIQATLPAGVSIELVDIVEEAEFTEHYQTIIPVLQRCDTEQQLYWPFNQQQLVAFIQSENITVN